MISWAVLREQFDIRCALDGQECFYVEYTSYPFRAVTAICFLFLALIQGAYGLKLVYMRKWQFLRFYISSPGTLATVNTILVLSFLSRAVYQIMFMLEAVKMPRLPLENSSDMSLLLFSVFMLWDYIPLALIIMTVTSTSVSAAIPNRVAAMFKTRLNYRSITIENGAVDGAPPSLPFSYATQSQAKEDDYSRSPNSIKSGCKEISPLLGNSSGASQQDSPRTTRQTYGVHASDTLLRFEAPVSLTPTSSWLSGLGHVSDDPQKYWRGGSDVSNVPILARGIAPMPQVFPQHHHASRGLVGSFESSGFAYEDLERAVRQAQREERNLNNSVAGGGAADRNIPSSSNDDKGKSRFATERERDLARERERLRKLELENKTRRVHEHQMGAAADMPMRDGAMRPEHPAALPPLRRVQIADGFVPREGRVFMDPRSDEDRSQGADRP